MFTFIEICKNEIQFHDLNLDRRGARECCGKKSEPIYCLLRTPIKPLHFLLLCYQHSTYIRSLTMKRFWKWVLDRKINSNQRWQSVVLFLDRDQQQAEENLKTFGGSYDDLKRKRKQSSKIRQDEESNYRSSISLQDFDIKNGTEPIDFDEFFQESSSAIELALVGSD